MVGLAVKDGDVGVAAFSEVDGAGEAEYARADDGDRGVFLNGRHEVVFLGVVMFAREVFVLYTSATGDAGTLPIR